MISQLPAPAKLNLFLYITGRRDDGYHLLQTLFQFLDYGDSLSIIPTTNGKIRLLTPVMGIMHEDNIIVNAAQTLQRYCWSNNSALIPGADIILKKRLPIGGGLGGGSSNAATVLLALNQQWQCQLNLHTLAQLSLPLGTDIPIFIHGRATFAEGIGEILTPIEIKQKWYMVTIPPVNLATQQIFHIPELKRDSPYRSLKKLLSMSFHNDCEPIVRKYFPVVEQHLSWLLKHAPARLTGTGACVFAEFNTEADARKVLSLAPSWMRGFVAQSVNISPLHKILSRINKSI